MFSPMSWTGTPTVNRLLNVQEKNIVAARYYLAASGFRIASEDVGGFGSRKIELDLCTGETRVERGPSLRRGTEEPLGLRRYRPARVHCTGERHRV